MGTLSALAAARSVLAAAGAAPARLGLCTFSAHQHWKAVADGFAGVQFKDALGFYQYARELGAEGVQTHLRPHDAAIAREIRARVERDHGYFEGDVRMPKDEAGVAAFETEIRLAREAGASVARTFLTVSRRYEAFGTMADFQRFHAAAERAIALVEPVLRRHRVKLAIENHKDHTVEEFVTLMRKIDSEWVGVLVDTGNNLALLDDPYFTVTALAPFALSVHFKDMALQSYADGFLLSEVPLGTGMLDLPRIVSTLRRGNPALVFNLEMATRDPLKVPCRTDAYWATFPERKATHLAAALARVEANPIKQPPPSLEGRTVAQVLDDEEANNRQGLSWMKQNLNA